MVKDAVPPKRVKLTLPRFGPATAGLGTFIIVRFLPVNVPAEA
jgi:hypothetical protein